MLGWLFPLSDLWTQMTIPLFISLVQILTEVKLACLKVCFSSFKKLFYIQNN